MPTKIENQFSRNKKYLSFDFDWMKTGRIELSALADLEGVQGVHSNPLLKPNYFTLTGHFEKFCVKLDMNPPFLHLNPLSKKVGFGLGLWKQV